MKKKGLKKLLLIVMLLFAMGLAGCPHHYYGRNNGHDNDRGHDNERDDHEHDQDTEHH